MTEETRVFRKGFALGALLFVISAVYAVWHASREGKATALTIGQPVPRFSLPGLLGAPEGRLESSRGKEVALVHFWASWCAPCLEELPGLLAFARSMEGQGVRVYAINLDTREEDARKVLPKGPFPANFTSLWDGKLAVSEAYGSYQFPETFVVDRELNLRAKWVGPQEWAESRYREALLALR